MHELSGIHRANLRQLMKGSDQLWMRKSKADQAVQGIYTNIFIILSNISEETAFLHTIVRTKKSS